MSSGSDPLLVQRIEGTIDNDAFCEDSGWHFLAVSFDTVSCNWAAYLDGALTTDGIENQAKCSGFAYGDPQLDLSFGKGFAGRLDELTLYEGVLTAAQIAEIFSKSAIPDGD